MYLPIWGMSATRDSTGELLVDLRQIVADGFKDLREGY